MQHPVCSRDWSDRLRLDVQARDVQQKWDIHCLKSEEVRLGLVAPRPARPVRSYGRDRFLLCHVHLALVPAHAFLTVKAKSIIQTSGFPCLQLGSSSTGERWEGRVWSVRFRVLAVARTQRKMSTLLLFSFRTVCGCQWMGRRGLRWRFGCSAQLQRNRWLEL